MKKPMLISLSLLTAASFSAVLVSTTTSTNFIFSKADEEATSITLNSSNRPTITGDSGSLVYNSYASFTYTKASESESGHVSLAAGGTIYKNEASKTLQSITATFDGDLRIQTSYKEGEIDYVYTLESGVEEPILGNYFKILTYDGASIENIDLTFGCRTAASGSNGYDLNDYQIVNPVAGETETMSINSFNYTFGGDGLTANVVNVDGNPELYIMIEEGKTKTITCPKTLYFSNLDQYEQVVVTGGGELKFEVESGDGLVSNDFVVEYGTKLKLSNAGTSGTGTGIKAYGILQIDGILNIDNYRYAFGLTSEVDVELAINVGTSGQLNVTDCTWGIYSWGKPANHTASINIAGKANITTQKCPVYISGASTPLTLTGSAIANLTSTAAIGIYSNGSIYVRDSASLNIDAEGGGIFNIRTLMVANGTEDKPEINSASLNVVCRGAKSTTGKDDSSNGLSKDGNMIQSSGSGDTKMIFATKGTVWVECTVTGKTGVQFTSTSNNKTHKLIIKTSNMTIKNANNTFGCWVPNTSSRTISTTYDYISEGLNKITLINCSNICNSGNDNENRFAPLLESDAVIQKTE